jgi:hypothetical protein
MSADLACFTDVFGLSRKDCACVDPIAVGANVSESGLYLDETPGLSLQLLSNAQDCGDGGLWDMLDKARASGIEDTISELGACIGAGTDARRQDGIAVIGDEKNATKTAHRLTKSYHGMTIQTAKVRGGRFRIIAIATAFKGTVPATIPVSIYGRTEYDGDVPLITYDLPATSGRIVWTTLPEPLDLDMSELGTGNPRFWALYEPTDGLTAMNSECSCGCGGFKPSWNENSPQYQSIQQKGGKLWTEWCMAAGTSGDGLDRRSEWGTVNPTQGLLLKVQFECDIRSTFCPDAPNYRYDEVMNVLAHTMRFKAAANLITQILQSTSINRYTMTAGDQLEALRDSYNKTFSEGIQGYLCVKFSEEQNINSYGDCRRCKDRWGMRRSTILS